MLLGVTRSPFYSVALLCFLAAGIYSPFGPFWALPSEFLTGYSAAAGIALINSVGNLGGFVGPYMIGAIATRTSTRSGHCWGPIIHISDARVAPAKESTGADKELIGGGWSGMRYPCPAWQRSLGRVVG